MWESAEAFMVEGSLHSNAQRLSPTCPTLDNTTHGLLSQSAGMPPCFRAAPGDSRLLVF